MEVLPDRVVDAVLDEVHRTRQRAVFGPWTDPTHVQSRHSRRRRSSPCSSLGALPHDPTRTSPRSAVRAPAVRAPAEPRARRRARRRRAEVSPSPAAQSLELTWTKVALDGRLGQIAWLGDRFVLVDEDSGAVSTSTDGASWQVLQPGDPDPGYVELLRGYVRDLGGRRRRVVEPRGWAGLHEQAPGDGARRPADRPSTRCAHGDDAVEGPHRVDRPSGPQGSWPRSTPTSTTDAWIASKLGDDWVSRYEDVSFKDGILEITMKRGRGLKVVWADEGFELGDYQDAGFGWYSPDGEQWTPMPAEAPSPDGDGGLGFLTGFGDVVGVSDGFIARGVARRGSAPCRMAVATCGTHQTA